VSAIYPLAPLGGLYIATVGACVVIGGIIARVRMVSVWIGLGLGIAAVTAFAGRFGATVAPTWLAIAALVIAVIVEFAAFMILMPRVRPRGERAVVALTLAIVGTHFLIMLPAFGPSVEVLGVACLVNAAAFWRMTGYGVQAAWVVDGLLKLGFGLAILRGM
jgi:hypothetical protein